MECVCVCEWKMVKWSFNISNIENGKQKNNEVAIIILIANEKSEIKLFFHHHQQTLKKKIVGCSFTNIPPNKQKTLSPLLLIIATKKMNNHDTIDILNSLKWKKETKLTKKKKEIFQHQIKEKFQISFFNFNRWDDENESRNGNYKQKKKWSLYDNVQVGKKNLKKSKKKELNTQSRFFLVIGCLLSPALPSFFLPYEKTNEKKFFFHFKNSNLFSTDVAISIFYSFYHLFSLFITIFHFQFQYLRIYSEFEWNGKKNVDVGGWGVVTQQRGCNSNAPEKFFIFLARLSFF